MPDLLWTATAVEDVIAITDYIAADNPTAALALVDKIDRKLARLRDHPLSGRPGRVPGTRELIVRPSYLVIYSDGTDPLRVLRVLHSAQMWP